MGYQFQCECGRRLRAEEGQVGRRGRCPGCGVVFIVPAENPGSAYMPIAVAEQVRNGECGLRSAEGEQAGAPSPPSPLPGGEEREEDAASDEGVDARSLLEPGTEISHKEPKPLERRYLSAFSYPLAPRGRFMIFAASVPLAVLVGVCGYASVIPLYIFLVIIVLFGVFTYFAAFCEAIIHETCEENDEVPDWPDFGDVWGDMLLPGLRFSLVGVLSFTPLLVAVLLGKDLSLVPQDGPTLAVRAALLLAGLLYLPMAVLGVTYYGSVKGGSPTVAIRAIRAAGMEYVSAAALLTGFALLSGAVLGSLVVLKVLAWGSGPVGMLFISPLMGVVLYGALLYVAMVESRIVGLMFRRTRGKLGWAYKPRPPGETVGK